MSLFGKTQLGEHVCENLRGLIMQVSRFLAYLVVQIGQQQTSMQGSTDEMDSCAKGVQRRAWVEAKRGMF